MHLVPSRYCVYVGDDFHIQKPTSASMYPSWVVPIAEMKGRKDFVEPFWLQGSVQEQKTMGT